MGFKVRGYNKVSSQEKTRDYSLFVIACEGTEREPEYFKPFNMIDRVKVDIVENEIGHRDTAPNKVLERVKLYIDEIGLSEENNDTLWCVIDVDRWPRRQIDELANYCSEFRSWNILISNPCFEIWLLYHKQKSLESYDCSKSALVKNHLHCLENGGYYFLNYLPLIQDAIENAKRNDSNLEHYYPSLGETKVYLLGEALMKKIGKVRFDKFVNDSLPKLRKCDSMNKLKNKI